MPYIAGIGAANVDIHSRGTGGPFRLRDSNLGEVHLTPGGVVRNMCEVLSRLDMPCELCTVVAQDPFGDMLLKNFSETNMGTKALEIFPKEEAATATYLDVLDETGDMIAAVCDQRIFDNINERYITKHLEILNGAEIVLLDANVSISGLNALAEKCERPIYMDPIATDLSERIRPYLRMCDTIKPNLQELEALSAMRIVTQKDLDDACSLVLDNGVKHLWISMGDRGLYYADANGVRLRGRSHTFDHCVNVTGAGDATMATIAWCTARGFDLETTMQYALAAGLVAISSDCTVNQDMSVALLESYREKYVL